jgi:hypothetical protein
LQAQPFGGAKATLLSLDQSMVEQDVSSITSSLSFRQDLFDAIAVACSK